MHVCAMRQPSRGFPLWLQKKNHDFHSSAHSQPAQHVRHCLGSYSQAVIRHQIIDSELPQHGAQNSHICLGGETMPLAVSLLWSPTFHALKQCCLRNHCCLARKHFTIPGDGLFRRVLSLIYHYRTSIHYFSQRFAFIPWWNGAI